MRVLLDPNRRAMPASPECPGELSGRRTTIPTCPRGGAIPDFGASAAGQPALGRCSPSRTGNRPCPGERYHRHRRGRLRNITRAATVEGGVKINPPCGRGSDPPPKLKRPMSILIVDDSEDMRGLLKTVLEMEGFQGVTTAGSARGVRACWVWTIPARSRRTWT